MKKTIAFLLLSFTLSSGVALAQVESTLEPEAAYKNTTTIPANSFTIPTVVEIPFEGTNLNQNSFLVIETNTYSYVPHLWRDLKTVIKTPIQIYESSRLLPYLNDSNQNTSEDFAIPSSGQGAVELVLTNPQTSFTSSEIRFDFGRNVTLPRMVAVYAAQSNGAETVVLATTTFPSSRVTFPTVTSNSLRVVIGYTQPLRINEVTVIEEEEDIVTTQGLRLLVQPGRLYEVLSNPDRSVTVTKSEGGNLRINQGVVLLATPTITDNPRYQPSDRDQDGIIDTLDNCPDASNGDQLDTNNNRIGDACEDFDRDTIINSLDNCPDQPNQDQADEDSDNIGDVCDQEESRLTEKYAWVLWAVMGLVGVILAGLFTVVIRHDPNLKKPDEEETI
jgi:hypothetical protein